VVNGTAGTPGADIKAEPAWAVTTGSASIVVGVVDSGIDYNHPDLAPNIWSNPGGIGGCPAGPHRHHPILPTCDPPDDNEPGTHVSGTIGAVGNNGIGVVGINWNVRLMGLKAFNAQGSGSLTDIIPAIDFAVQAKRAGVNVRALNNSWAGDETSQALLDEVNLAGSEGILFVAGAGNGNIFGIGFDNDAPPGFFSAPQYPCSLTADSVVCVAAVDQNDQIAFFSNYGAKSV